MIRKYKNNLLRRKLRVRAKIRKVSSGIPRLSVFRSNKHIYAQIIDVINKGRVLVAASDCGVKNQVSKSDKALKVGEILAKKALRKGIKRIVFDRSGYNFHGRVEALAKAAREKGLEF